MSSSKRSYSRNLNSFITKNIFLIAPCVTDSRPLFTFAFLQPLPSPRDWPHAASFCEVPSESKSTSTAGRRELTAPEPDQRNKDRRMVLECKNCQSWTHHHVCNDNGEAKLTSNK
ncbi:hypothetical protein FOIG_00910 [Fusarium odoratissimum NRRL 54006]|uniref:Uncharacterized protein n=2 Tax=Fusarium oxysporum species complex TaxID=171631 RepID=X0LR88_FUSO5|nr:uncharacterized protein FOIG_00910 [Fusarium odoratissimum NRRL 54006]EXM11080.1 hypothetical protein FOIG_00910 [Fusarium odoratissimum NRRL 54006]TXC03472.1 hypothetical protein FocTR4_00001243 [Fusarium oxysporum f. sp. cubense]